MSALFEDFDFAALDSPAYKEDAVREDILAPILRQIGYRESGDMRMERSKPLVHPFVKIGSKDHRISIIPDYTLYYKDKAVLVIDAKGPSEQIIKSRHSEQAFSYAIHPEVRAKHYGLCNGKHFVVYAIDTFEPVLDIKIQDVDDNWDKVYEALHPKFLLDPGLRNFDPDFGLCLLSAGFKPGFEIFAFEFYLQEVCRPTEELYTSSAMCELADTAFIVSFDYGPEIFDKIMDGIPSEVSSIIRLHLSRMPYTVELGGKVIIDIKGRLGDITRGQYESFAPVVLYEVMNIRFDPTVVLEHPRGERPTPAI